MRIASNALKINMPTYRETGMVRIGAFTRFMLGHYLWFIQITFLAILSVVTAINIAPEIQRVWLEAAETGFPSAISRSVQYVFLRLLDNGSQIFPIALVLGVVWTEIAHAASGRRTMVRGAGMSFIQGSSALFIIAGLTVPVQLLLDNFARPYAYMKLSKEGLGEYGWRYLKKRSERTYWLSFSGDVLQTRLRDETGPRFGEATLYRFNNNGDLAGITDIAELRPEKNAPDRWMIINGRSWVFADSGQLPAANASNSSKFDRTVKSPARLNFPISRLWLEYRDIHPKYIPFIDLISLSRASGLPDNHPKYREWLEIRIAQPFTSALMIVSIVAIFSIFLDRIGLIYSAGIMLSFGYVGFVLTRIMSIIAQHGVIAASVAIWSLPVLLLFTAITFVMLIRRRDRYFENPASRVTSDQE